jgi:uncharacterized membrane protein (DUF106 family)
MDTLLVINSILVATCLYFIKDFHTDFKEVKKSLQEVKEKFGEQSAKTDTEIKSVENRVDKLEKKHT